MPDPTSENPPLPLPDGFARFVADHVPAGVGYWDHDLRGRFVNAVFCDWFGVAREAVIGRTLDDVFGTGRVGPMRPHLARVLRGEAQQFEHHETRADGRSATLSIRCEPDLRDGRVRGFFMLAVDETPMRVAEQTRQRLNDELDQARHKAQAASIAKTAFLGNVGHEIRTPMNAIIGLTHLLRRDPAGPQARERLDRVSEAADRLMAIVNDVLDLSKIESGKLQLVPAEFDLEDLVVRAAALVDAAARRKGIRVAVDIGALPRRVHGDALRLSQALGNLLDNAVKFTETGSVALVGSLEETRGDTLRIRFAVRDTGIGIEPGRLEHIFTAFEQADGTTTRRFGGIGLGLGITRQLARLMGGDAGVTSRPGAGSTFWIAVVLEAVPDEPRAPAGGALAGKRLLLVDDLVDVRTLLQPMLRRLGLRVDVAESGYRALTLADAAEREGDPYEAALIDWLMPHMDGLETARRLLGQARGAAPACLLMSTSCDARMLDQALELGVSSLLQKPVSFSTLNDHLMTLLVGATGPVAEPLPPGAEARARRRHAGGRVLLAEDNPVNQDVALGLLLMAGLDVDVAGNGLQAVEMAGAKAYDLILMDIQMPTLDGLEATRRLRAMPGIAHTPIVAMTANAQTSDRDQCLAAGMNDFLTKPIDASSLYGALGRWLTLADATAPPPDTAPHDIDRLSGIDGLDVRHGLAFCGGDAALLRRSLLQLVALYDGEIPAARAFVAAPTAASIEALRRELHSIGGACAALGVRAVAERAARVGDSLRALPRGPSDHDLERVVDELDVLTQSLRTLLAQVGERLAQK